MTTRKIKLRDPEILITNFNNAYTPDLGGYSAQTIEHWIKEILAQTEVIAVIGSDRIEQMKVWARAKRRDDQRDRQKVNRYSNQDPIVKLQRGVIGFKEGSVIHAVCTSGVKAGRLNRQSGQGLCKYSRYDVQVMENLGQVTCKECLKIINKTLPTAYNQIVFMD